jgi:hypothetical protein
MGLFLISGPTGNVGMEVLQSLYELKTESKIIAGTKDIATAQKKLAGYPSLNTANSILPILLLLTTH